MKAIDKSRDLFNNYFMPRLEERYPECVGNFAAGLDFLSRQVKGQAVDFALPQKGKGSEEALGR